MNSCVIGDSPNLLQTYYKVVSCCCCKASAYYKICPYGALYGTVQANLLQTYYKWLRV